MRPSNSLFVLFSCQIGFTVNAALKIDLGLRVTLNIADNIFSTNEKEFFRSC